MQRLVVLAMLVGCGATEEEARCGEAAEVLASCHGIDGETFLAACEQASPEAAAQLTDAVLGQTCPSDGKADGLGEWAFVEACRPVIMSAYLVNEARNPARAPLSAEMKTQLRPHFGGLVDRVRVHWNATLPDDWPMLHVEDAFMDVGAQTFGTEIFVSAEAASLSTIAHELVHAAQAERVGGALAFYREYCRAFYEAGYRYDDNAYEVEAYALRL